MKIVVTIVGKDSVGIIAAVSTLLAENGVNILSINQNIMDGFFNMVMIADMAGSKIELAAVRQLRPDVAGGKQCARTAHGAALRLPAAAQSDGFGRAVGGGVVAALR